MPTAISLQTLKVLSIGQEEEGNIMESVTSVSGTENRGISSEDPEQSNLAKKSKKREKSIYKGGTSSKE